MADFAHIQSVQTVVGEGGKALLQLRVAGSQELLQVTVGHSYALKITASYRMY
jgi:hypothetical protein